jgi:hypothetical protein
MVEQLSANRFMVHSESGKVYKISLTGESKSTISCDCSGFLYRRRCKHVDEVKAFLDSAEGGNRKLRVKAQPKDKYIFVANYKEQIRQFLKGGVQ